MRPASGSVVAAVAAAVAASAAPSPFPAADRVVAAAASTAPSPFPAGIAADRVRRALPRSLVRTRRRRSLLRVLRVRDPG